MNARGVLVVPGAVVGNHWLTAINKSCDSSDGRAAASYPADQGSNFAVSCSNEIPLSIIRI